ncbi:hypothetical protein HanIR_Chr15g0778331 [Helianthus annuus]|nr:hypothetical protein HanIR_Chr15g0778331 [Helianthus annuus]
MRLCRKPARLLRLCQKYPAKAGYGFWVNGSRRPIFPSVFASHLCKASWVWDLT